MKLDGFALPDAGGFGNSDGENDFVFGLPLLGSGVDFAAAGWAYDVPEIEAFMRKNCDFYFKTVQEFRTFLEED